MSQTDGDPIPERPVSELLTGQAPPGLWGSLRLLVEAEGYAVTRGDCQGANGRTDFVEHSVRVRNDIDDAQAVKTLAHEAGHVLLHAPERREGLECRGLIEVEAESVAYLVTAAHGLDASQYTFNYVAGWAHRAAALDGRSVEEIVKASGQRVIGTADRILQATHPGPTLVDRALDDLALEVGRGLVATPEHRSARTFVEGLGGQAPARGRDTSAADRSATWEIASPGAPTRSRSDARRVLTARSVPMRGR